MDYTVLLKWKNKNFLVGQQNWVLVQAQIIA